MKRANIQMIVYEILFNRTFGAIIDLLKIIHHITYSERSASIGLRREAFQAG
jgi:hypothetical protein